MSYDSTAGTFDINGITQFTATETPPEISSNIFWGNIGTQSGSPYTDPESNYIGTVYSFIISQNNKPLANYQPAVQCASNNTLSYGFLDSVSGNFITSTAGDSFTATTPVEYSDYCIDVTSPVEPPVIPPIKSEKPDAPSMPVVSVPNTGFRR